MTRQPRAMLVTVGIMISLMLGGVSAYSHTVMVGTSPAADALLNESPSQVVVRFADPLGAAQTAEVRVGERDIAGGVRLDEGDARRLIIPITDRALGQHRVSWVVIAADGHAMSGELSFTVRLAPLVEAAHRLGDRLLETARAVSRMAHAPVTA